MRTAITGIILAVILTLPLTAHAFNEDFIISDSELEDYNSMSYEEIKEFLLERGSFLAYHADFYPANGLFMDAAQIIEQTARDFRINPKFILVMLEKEQSLISYKLPSQRRLDWAMGYAVCDRCELAHPLVAKYRGFAKQVYHAAEKIRASYLEDLKTRGYTQNGFGPGISKKLDGHFWVTPANYATAILYTYTPHVRGNKNFYLIWRRWFSDITYPEGSLLQDAKTGGIYLLQNGKKRPFLSKAAFTTRYSDKNIIPVDAQILMKYPDGEPIKFPNYSLLKDKNGMLYMTDGDFIRQFESEHIFRYLGFQDYEIEEVTQEDILSYQSGSVITIKSAYPTGGLLQDKITGGVYWVNSGVKHPIWHKSALAIFEGYKIISQEPDSLEQFPTGDPVKFPNGTLLKGSAPTVYFVSENKLHSIPSEDVFLTYNWKWENIIWTSDKILNLYKLGNPLSIEGFSLSLSSN